MYPFTIRMSWPDLLNAPHRQIVSVFSILLKVQYK